MAGRLSEISRGFGYPALSSGMKGYFLISHTPATRSISMDREKLIWDEMWALRQADRIEPSMLRQEWGLRITVTGYYCWLLAGDNNKGADIASEGDLDPPPNRHQLIQIYAEKQKKCLSKINVGKYLGWWLQDMPTIRHGPRYSGISQKVHRR